MFVVISPLEADSLRGTSTLSIHSAWLQGGIVIDTAFHICLQSKMSSHLSPIKSCNFQISSLYSILHDTHCSTSLQYSCGLICSTQDDSVLTLKGHDLIQHILEMQKYELVCHDYLKDLLRHMTQGHLIMLTTMIDSNDRTDESDSNVDQV